MRTFVKTSFSELRVFGRYMVRLLGRSEGLRFQVARDTVGVMGVTIVSMGLNFISNVFLVRLLDLKEFGIYAFATSLVGFLSGPAALGFPQLVIREIASYKVKGEREHIEKLFLFSQRTVLLASLGLMPLVALGLWVFLGKISQKDVVIIALALLALPLLALIRLQSSVLQGFGDVLAGQVISGFLQPVCFLVFLGGIVLLGYTRLTAPLVLGLQVIAIGLTLLVGGFLLSRYVRGEVRIFTARIVKANPTWIQDALWLLLLTLLNLIPQYGGVLMLGMMRGSEAVGLYKAAYQAASLVPLGLMVVIVVLGPTLSQLYTQGDLQRLRKVIVTGTSLSLAMALPFFLIYIINGTWFLSVMFGGSYLPSLEPLVILATAFMAQVAGGVIWHALLMSGYEQKLTAVSTFATLTFIFANAIFIQLSGISGTAIAMAIYFGLIVVFVVSLAKRHGFL